MKMRIPALFVCAALALAACGDDNGINPSDLDRGEFEGTIRGEFSADVQGTAESGNSIGFGQNQIILTDLSEDVIIFMAHLDDEFNEGRESLADLNDNTGVGVGVIVGDRLFIADGGTIDIDDISSAGIRGTVEFTAIEVDLDTEEVLDDEVRVDVAFNTDYNSNCCFSRTPMATYRINKAPAK